MRRPRFARSAMIGAALLTFSFVAVGQEDILSQEELATTIDAAKAAYVDGRATEAVALFNKAARWGDKYSQLVLGRMHMEGAGTPKDPITGYAWLKTAAEAPLTEFKRYARQARKALSKQDLAAADKLAEELINHHGMAAVGVTCSRRARTGTNIKVTICEHTRINEEGDILLAQNDKKD